MRVLFLLRSSVLSSAGGAEVQADLLCREFVANGHDVHYAYDGGSAKPVSHTGNITYHSLPDHGRLYVWLNAMALRRVIDEVKPQIIYQRVRSPYTALAVYWGRRRGIRVVHGISSDASCCRNTFPWNRAFLPNVVYEYMGRYGLRNSDLIIAQTHAQQELLEQNFNVKSVVIPNGHPVPCPPFAKASPPIVAWVANMRAWKRPELFIQLAEELQHTNARFVIAGRVGDKRYHAMLSEKTQRLANLSFQGPLSLSEVNDLLSRASIFVNTSQPREGFPNTFIQSWLRETPVVSLAFDPDGLIKRHGLGLQSGTCEQLAQDVGRLIDNEHERVLMGRHAREHAVTHYDIKNTASSYAVAFQPLVV